MTTISDCVVCQRSHTSDGYRVCRGCEQKLVDTLTEVVERYHMLCATSWLVPQPTDEARRGRGYASRSPARDRALAMLDARTRTSRPHDPRSVLATLRTYTTIVRTQHHLEWRASATVDSEAQLLGTWWDWTCRQDWVGELARDLRVLRRQLRTETGEPPHKPVGHCMNTVDEGASTRECGAALFAPHGGSAIQCRHCGRVYDGLDLVKLELAQAS